MISFSNILIGLAVFGLFFYMMKNGGGCCGGHNHNNHGGTKDANTRKDPVCGMDVSNDKDYSQKHDGKEYSFCSAHCLEQFRNNPDEYLGKEGTKEEHGGGCCH